MSKVIGIDLGTTNSCVAVMEGNEPVVIANAEGQRTTPSVVAFSKAGDRLVGDPAKRQAATNVRRTISSVKRAMGTAERYNIDGKNYSPQEISSMILRKLKEDAENYLGEKVEKAVITVPAYFNDAQRQATKDAGRIAGLEVLRIINEPTSAALAYGLDHGQPQKIMVYDLGGGTFDVSLIEIGDNLIEVLATAGDNHLGGDDFDEKIVNWIVEEYKRTNRVNLVRDIVAMQRIREAATEAKKALSAQTVTTINLPFIATVKGEPIHLEMDLSRATFNEITADLVARTEAPVQKALSDAGVTTSELGMVLLVGGSTRIPAVQEKVQQMTGKIPSHNLNPDECVALGAAVQGGKLGGAIMTGNAAELILMDVTPLSLSIETVGGIATKIIDRNTTIPTRVSQVFSTAANYQTTVEIKVLQGERQFARDNTLLGNFKLRGIRRAPAGVPQIEVTFDIDANGIVNVSARDKDTGKQKAITITSSSNLSDMEIEQAIRDAQAYASEDTSRKDKFDAINRANISVQEGQRYLSQFKKQLDRQTKNEIKTEISVLTKMLRGKKPENLSEQEYQMLLSQTRRVRDLTGQQNEES